MSERAARRRFAEEACEAEAVFAGDGEREAEDRRVEMQVRVAVPVRRREAEGAEFFKLRADFGGERRDQRWTEEVAQTGLRGRRLEISGGIGERGNLRGASGAEREMQTDAEARMPVRGVRGFVGVGLVHHEAGLREDACFVATLDGFIDAGAAAKVVAGEDEGFQNADRAGTLARDADVFARLPVFTQGMNWVMAFFQIGLVAICLAGLLHAMLASLYVSDWKRDELHGAIANAELPPLTLLRPIKAGVPALREKLGELARGMRAGDRLVLGVNDESHDAEIADSVRAEFAERDIVVVRCRADAALNPKISKLVQMESAAGGEHWVLSDSEARIDAVWLDAFRREWAASGADAMTCGYRFVGGASWMQALDAAPTLFSLWPGLMFVRRFGRMNFTLGACTGLRRSDLATVGGWAAFADELAEDNRLGAALAKAGKTIRLSRQVATLESDPLTWRDCWRHQRRMAVTYRVCNPAGFAGMIFTRSVWAGALLIALPSQEPERRWIWLAMWVGVLFGRWFFFRDVAMAVAFPRARLFSTMLVSDAVETVCWALAWISPTVWWAGKCRRISRDGKLSAG